MAMPKVVHCKRCRRHVSECGKLSARKICIDCAEKAMVESTTQIVQKSGPAYTKYVKSMKQYARNLNRGGTPSTPPMPDAPEGRDTT